MKILKYIISLLLIMTFTSHAFAEFKFEAAPELVSQEEDSVTISWEAIEWAFGYYIYYGTESVANDEELNWYEFEWDDLIEWTEYTIGWLESNETYYISVVWMDEEAEQTPYSDELTVVFGDGWSNTEETSMWDVEETAMWGSEEPAIWENNNMLGESLKLEDVTFMWDKSIFLSFNKDLDSSDTAERDIKVTDLSTGMELGIESISLSESKYLDIIFQSPLKTSTEYEVTVITLSDSEYNNIEVWVYWTSKVISPASFQEEIIEEQIVEEVIEEPLEAAPIEPKKLPDTWAKEIILVLAALLLWALLLNFRTRES